MGINKKVTETTMRHCVRNKIVIPYQHTEEDKSEHVVVHFNKNLKVFIGTVCNSKSRIKDKISAKRHFNMISGDNSSRNYNGGWRDKTKDLIEKHMLKE